MPESCTVYCKIASPGEVTALLNRYFPSKTSIMEDSLVAAGSEGSLRLSQKRFGEPGDEFCRLLLGTSTFVDGLSCKDPVAKKAILSHVVTSKLVIGVVADPAFDSDERYSAVVFAIAKSLDGIIFNGIEILSPTGEALIPST